MRAPIGIVFAAKTGRVSGSVPAFVMAPDQRRDGAGERDCVDDLGAHLRVDLHLLALVRAERSRLREDVLGHRELADVVKERGRLDRLGVTLRQREAAREAGGIVLHALDVHAARGVLGLNRARQHLGAFTMELRPIGNAPLFVGDAIEVDAVRAVRQAQRQEGEARFPLPDPLPHFDGDPRGHRAHDIARDAPEEVVVPDLEHRPPVRKRKRRRDRRRVHEEVRHRRAH